MPAELRARGAIVMALMLAEMQAPEAEARAGGVRWKRASTLVGRLCNLAQVFPELKPLLRGGYA
eukprot:4515186-Pleurochrysis_carterae.AAC.1